MNNLWDDKLHEECGVFGIYGHTEAARMTYLGLYALQHRGQESCGIAVSNGQQLVSERDMGYVSEVFHQARLDRLPGPASIGHVRYSTAGEVSIRECQPFVVTCQHGQIAVCHNGNLPFAREERKRLEKEGAIFSSTSDTEVVLHGVARSRAASVAEAIPVSKPYKLVSREVKPDNTVVFVAGVPVGRPGQTNLVKVEVV